MKKSFEVELDLPAASAWDAVAEKFGEAGRWTSLLKSSWMEGEVAVGGKRICEQLNGKRAIEEITHYDPVRMTLAYELTEGGPPIMKSARNKWTVEALGSHRSKVVMQPDLTLRWWATPIYPLFWYGLNKTLVKVLEEFKNWAEKEEVPPRVKENAA